MEMALLEEEVKSLSGPEQDRLSALLTVLRMEREGTFAEIEARLDDDRPQSWLRWSDAKSQLDIGKS